MVQRTEDVERVCEEDVFGHMKQGGMVVVSSTIDPNATRSLAEEASRHSLSLIDAPVSGGVHGAEAGTLTFMVGGGEGEVRRAHGWFKAMGGKIVHCGDVGSGMVVKMCNNLLLGANLAVLCEAFNLGMREGVDAQILHSVISASSGNSYAAMHYHPVPGIIPTSPSSNNYNPGFSTALMHKDLAISAQAAIESNIPLPVATAALNAYSNACNAGLSHKDCAILFQQYQSKSKW